eukprot:16039916-Heterocapsa_arctica.AAC.1
MAAATPRPCRGVGWSAFLKARAEAGTDATGTIMKSVHAAWAMSEEIPSGCRLLSSREMHVQISSVTRR